jgi:hypothetical protein
VTRSRLRAVCTSISHSGWSRCLLLGLVIDAGGCRPTPPVPTDVTFPVTVTLQGEVTRADYETLRELPFDVPAGTSRIELRLEAEGSDARTVFDVGLRSPEGLRGWSGGRRERLHVSALDASAGYLPGPISAGRWAVILGVPNVREGRRDAFRVEVTLSDRAREWGPAVRRGSAWYAGDLHAHSGHSDGRIRVGTPQAIGGPVHVVFDAARQAGLDFVTLSDHNTAAHWLDVARLQPFYAPMLLLPGREVTTYRGHANTVGERAFHEFRLSSPQASPVEVMTPIRESGAFVSINHPGRPDDETCMGCGWNVDDDAMLKAVDGVEIVNGMTHSGPQSGWAVWARWLNRGHRLTAVGGSDEHTPDETNDYALGQPTTVVWADELSEAALVAGLKAGRVYVRVEGPGGPTLDLRATDGTTEWHMGDEVPAGPLMRLTFHAVVGRAEGQTLEWVRNGEVVGTRLVNGPQVTLFQSLSIAVGDWVTVVLRRGDQPTLFGNPIYAGARRR